MLQVPHLWHLITVPSYHLQICRRIKMIHLLGGHTWGRCDAPDAVPMRYRVEFQLRRCLRLRNYRNSGSFLGWSPLLHIGETRCHHPPLAHVQVAPRHVQVNYERQRNGEEAEGDPSCRPSSRQASSRTRTENARNENGEEAEGDPSCRPHREREREEHTTIVIEGVIEVDRHRRRHRGCQTK